MYQHLIAYYYHLADKAQDVGYLENALEFIYKAQHFEYMQELEEQQP